MDGKIVLLITHLSFMNRIRSLANSPRLDKHENPNSANVKKKMPVTTIRTEESKGKLFKQIRTHSILETRNIIPETTTSVSNELNITDKRLT